MTSFADATAAVEKATTLDEISELFMRCFYGRNSAEAKEKFYLEVHLVNELQQLSSMDNPSPIKLYDFLNASVHADEKIFADNPKYMDITEQAKKVTGEMIKQEMEKYGLSLANNIISGKFISPEKLLDSINNLSHDWKLVIGKSKRQSYDSDDIFEADRNLLAEKVWIDLQNKYPDKEHEIKGIISGRWLRGAPKTKAERIFIKHLYEARDRCFHKQDEKFSDNYKYLRKKILENEKIVNEQTERIYQQVTSAITQASPISLEEAEKWAQNNVYISDKVAKKLDDSLYPPSQLRKDIAQYYRFVGGKLGPVEFITERRNNRAFARGRLHICIDNDFDKSALFHECSHLVEAWDQSSLLASRSFVKSRATGRLRQLKDLDPKHNYRNDEYAYPDNFIESYVGKDYGEKASEVMSIAMEHLASPTHLAIFIAKDPEHFNLMLGQCLHQNEHIKIETNALNETTSKKAAEINKKIIKIEKFIKSIDKAISGISPAFEAMLENANIKEPYTFSIYSSKSKAILSYTNENGQTYSVYNGSKKEALRAAYLYFLSNEKKIPVIFDPSMHTTSDAIYKYASGFECPTWFDDDKDFPKLNFSQDLAQQSKDLNSRKKDAKNRNNKFQEALESAISNTFADIMKSDEGYEGYSLFLYRYSNTASLYSTHIASKYICDDTVNNCLKLAYLLILNKNDMLPENYGNDLKAYHKFIEWIERGVTPDWFDTKKGIPELKL